jgi:hypothetical protein
MKMNDAAMLASEPKWAIVDADGAVLWGGDALSIEIIFNCLARLNFDGEKYQHYLVWMIDFTAKAFPGRPNPYAKGRRIVLIDDAGRKVASHQFD